MARLRQCNLFINGREVKPSSRNYFIRENPATEKDFAQIAESNAKDVDRAVGAARKAFGVWSKVPPAERVKILLNIADILAKNQKQLALLNTQETGKPIRESSIVEVGGCIRTLEYYAGAHTELSGETIPINENQFSMTIKEPVGVVAQIIPWNFPLILSFWKIAPAIVAGCTIVLKPAELTSCTIFEISKLCSKAGLPDGVLNIVPGKGEVAGQALVEHPDIDKVAFTGSTSIGKHVMRTAADTIKRVSLELGGKAPCIIFDDADIENAVEACLRGGFFNQGENCTAVTKLMLHKKIYKKFMDLYIKRVKKINIGDPTKPDTELGAVISREHFESVLNYISKGKSEGARVAAGGSRPRKFKKGYFISPTVLENVDPNSTVTCEEIFGPVVAVIPFTNEDEAIGIANNTEYGLAGGVWTKDINRAMRVARSVKAGYLWINTYGGIIPQTPYGGFKQSGIGKELGKEGIENYLETKCVNIYTGGAMPKWYKG
ncbi:MAG: aldehyde dehydrogenase [Candidatus Dadabacteria bacterium]|nr:aldehyde dehydrogenase [Candidatus Dadabacteria bacterium]NIS07807.1 aldehyde dehydrogenase [Candidatus Dadabacteria bacterium]NIV43027.1 aldehyde dehydrogenase family protein [Candidatus Dadabacteria bacterium]NIY21425.1 aldehyde dehydrogenase family protein [Candidatus Dadabacteria bacterium]